MQRQLGSVPPRNLGVLLAQQARTSGHQPLLTYYDDLSAERTELSYATFDNWVSKTANLLAEELGAGRRTRLSLRLTDHWIGAVVAAAAWKLGAVVDVGATDDAPIVLVAEAERDTVAADHPGLVVVGNGMGGRVEADGPGLPYGDEVLAFGDDYDDPAVFLDDPATTVSGQDVTQAEIYARASAVAEPDARLLATGALTAEALVVAVPLCAGASVVWCPRAADADLTRRIADERITHRLSTDGSVQPI